MADPDAVCRICLDRGDEPLISPCNCRCARGEPTPKPQRCCKLTVHVFPGDSGTQAFVHPTCLRMWQRSRDTAMRRNICPVCRVSYSAEYVDHIPIHKEAPPEQPWPNQGGPPMVFKVIIAGAIFLFFGVQSPIVAAVVSVVTFQFGAFWTMLESAFESFIRIVFGVRLCFVVDDAGAPLLRIVRVGSQINGLAAGALLVATHRIRGGIFDKSVVLITEHNRHGTHGYILNQPFHRLMALGHAGMALDDDPALGPPLRHTLHVPEAPDGAVQHGIGGPVDIGGWAAVLHEYADVAGAAPLVQPTPAGGAREAAAAAAVAAEAEARREEAVEFEGGERAYYLGGDLAALREKVRAEGGTARAGGRCALKVLHGHSAWAPGQLEGEIRTGAWTWAAGIGPAFALSTLDRADARGEVLPEGGGALWVQAAAAVAAVANAANADEDMAQAGRLGAGLADVVWHRAPEWWQPWQDFWRDGRL